eukprot:11797959-Alexandrium_andersonii.AAC.1
MTGGRDIVRVVFRGDVYRTASRRASTGSPWGTGSTELRECAASVHERVVKVPGSSREYHIIATYPRGMPPQGRDAMATVLCGVFGEGSVRFVPVDRGGDQAQSAANAAAASAE